MSINKSITFPCIKVKQPIGDFYIGSIKAKDLCEITKVDVRRLKSEERGFESYLGIQRPLNEKRVTEIAKYVDTVDACFPTAVILAVPGVCAKFNAKVNELTLSPYENKNDKEKIDYDEMASVLDGQHRIEGLRNSNSLDGFEINVSLFIDIDIADQAYIFSTVNLAQTKVNKSLVYDLFDLAKKRSPQKTCHNIAVALDKTKDSPFYMRIKRLGVSTEGRFNETITQATIVESLLKYIAKDPISDRNDLIKNRKIDLATTEELKIFIFRNMFLKEKDLEITDVIWNYFDAVKLRWPKSWDFEGRGQILNKTNGFKALMRFLRNVYLYITIPGGVPTTKEFLEVLKKIKIDDLDFSTDEFKPGSSGEGKLYSKLKELSGI